ncbi:MAG: DUF2164 domain-containing protein [Gemmatimonadota bacterium]|jgi:uncharacterized protein (DUF2164 family)
MALNLDDERRAEITRQLQAFYLERFDEELSDFRAAQLVDFFLGTLAAPVYNQAVQDARRFMLEKLDDLDGEVYEPEGT